MARIFPEQLPDYIVNDPLRSAERKIYDLLSRQLPRQYTVYYSRPWLGTMADGREVDGEADFVVAHPDLGVLTIEVKGGAVSHDARTGLWGSVDRNGVRHRIRNPVDQARRSKHEILAKLRSDPTLKHRFIPMAHGVILPDSARPSSDLGADMPLDLFAFEDDLGHLKEWVNARFEAAESEEYAGAQGLGVDGLAVLDRLLAFSFQLRTRLGSTLGQGESHIITMTQQQYQILDGLESARRMAIAGGAGTGKTVLALEKARRLAASGQRTLLTCFNRPLAEYLRHAAEGVDNLVVASFHELCFEMGRRAGLLQGTAPDEDGPGAKDYFDVMLPEVLLDAMEKLPEHRFGAVVVDEGQDLLAAWFVPLENCLEDPEDGTFYVFYDDNQRLYGSRSIASCLPKMAFRLTLNLRNAKPIFQASIPFYAGHPMTPAGPEGREVERVTLGAGQDLRGTVEKIVERLVDEEKVPVESIAVLTGGPLRKSRLAGSRQLGRFRTTTADKPEPGRLVLDSTKRFKGLERPVVVLTDLEHMVDEPELLYVGISRARLHLIVVGSAQNLSIVCGRPKPLATV